MIKHSLTAAALAIAIASPAFAQQMNKPDGVVQSSTSTQVGFVQNENATDWRGSKLIGATVYGPDNASIGEINDVLIANDGKIKAAVIGVGGFLSVGEKNVAVPFDQLNISRKPESSSIDKIAVSFTKEQLKSAPKFAYFDAPKTQTTGSSVTDKLKSMSPVGNPSKDK